MILGIDTSTSAIAVALAELDAAGVVTVRDQRAVLDPQAHTEHLAPLIDQALTAVGASPTQLSRIVVGTGPGPFTGLRVGIVTAVTMGLALGVPVHGVCSLDALALAAIAGGQVPGDELLVATDARRKEVYWARYAAAQVQPDPAGDPAPSRPDGVADSAGRDDAAPRVADWWRIEGPAVDRPGELPAAIRALPTVGRGHVLFPEAFAHPLPAPIDVDAASLLEVAGPRIATGETMPVAPLYLRRPDALTTAERAGR